MKKESIKNMNECGSKKSFLETKSSIFCESQTTFWQVPAAHQFYFSTLPTIDTNIRDGEVQSTIHARYLVQFIF